MSSGTQKTLGAIGGMLGQASVGKLEPEQAQMREGIRSAISSVGPIGAIIGAASGVVDAIGAATGLNIDNMDKNAAKRFGIKGAGVNNFMNILPANSMIWGMFAGKTDQAHKSALVDEYRGGYGGSAGDIDAARELSNKRFVFGRKAANKAIAEANEQNRKITDIGMTNNLRKQSTYGEELASQNQRKYSGGDPSRMAIGKHGMRITKLQEVRELLSKFQKGGKISTIVEGSFHSRKHHLDEVSDTFADVTPKGIPVISIEDGKPLQHAEVEQGEFVVSKSMTEQLEALYKDGSEEAMIEAGKLLTKELILNTDDRTGKFLDGGIND